MSKNAKKNTQQFTPFLQQQKYTSGIGLFVLLLLLFSACGSTSGKSQISKQPFVPPTPTLSTVVLKDGEAQLQTYAWWINLLKRSGGQSSIYNQHYLSVEQSLAQATTQSAYNADLVELNTQISAIQVPALRAEAQQLQRQFHQQVISWGQKHIFHNAYDNTDYPQGYEYADNGIGGWIQDDLAGAQTPADYQQTLENLRMYQTNFQATQENARDKTPYNQLHKTDLKLLEQYGKNGKALIISLGEQAMRIYDHEKLVNAFFVTTGRPDRPTPPGVWWIEGKMSPTIFKSGVPPGSPDWYPDTPINYAMQYHSDGYFIHDSWWRNDYGPGTNYPHIDSSGDSFSSQGSHGCVNVALANAAWLYNFVEVDTSVIIY